MTFSPIIFACVSVARHTTRFVCQSCGAAHPRWVGRCDACGDWNTLTEEAVAALPKGPVGQRLSLTNLADAAMPAPRRMTGIGELDRVLGGGLVEGASMLIGGDPGIGKSTLLLQTACRLAATTPTAYITGEEAVDQIRLRARRLGLTAAPLSLASATSVRDIAQMIGASGGPRVVVIDSIQTMYLDTLESAPGSVAQVRASAAELMRAARHGGTTLFLVGHVTKDGMIAGPRVLEHMVDAVLYFEGERGHGFRILRAVKNRFGPTDEIGVFEMTDGGLAEVANPSELFLAGRAGDISGSAVFAGVEGTRPVLVEVQALIAPSPMGSPRRAVVGLDAGRLAMILAVLETRCAVSIGANDVYVNVAGGLKITEPAADLAIAAALISSLTGTPVPRDAVVFGEIGLSGEVRPAGQTDQRLREAVKLGFQAALMPARLRHDRTEGSRPALSTVIELTSLAEIMPLFTNGKVTTRPRATTR